MGGTVSPPGLNALALPASLTQPKGCLGGERDQQVTTSVWPKPLE